MKRVLDFKGDKGNTRFEFCYMAILGAGDQKGTRDRMTIRKEARLLDALDSISIPLQIPMPSGSPRALSGPDYILYIQEEDHALLVTYVDSMPWVPKVAREAVDVQDFLSSADRAE